MKMKVKMKKSNLNDFPSEDHKLFMEQSIIDYSECIFLNKNFPEKYSFFIKHEDLTEN